MRHVKRVVATGLVLLLMVQATGCTSWKTVAQPAPAAVAQHPGRKLQVVLLDGRTIKADSARTSADALLTYHNEPTAKYYFYATVADTIPLIRVRAVKVGQGSAGNTIGLVLGIAAGLFVAGAVAFLVAYQDCCW